MTGETFNGPNAFHPKAVVTIQAVDAALVHALTTHHEKFRALLDGGVFDTDNGQITINMHEGRVKTVHVDTMTYPHRRQPPNMA